MKQLTITIILTLLLISCNKKTELETIFNCTTSESFTNLEKVTDVKELFTIQLPKHWKTNLYFDAGQTSIYSADTTKQLTETTLIDVSFLYKNVKFDTSFKEKTRLKATLYQLTETTSKELIFLEKPSYISVLKGRKGDFNYQAFTLYVQVNESNTLVLKTEVYGDSLISNRFCKAIKLLEKIQLK